MRRLRLLTAAALAAASPVLAEATIIFSSGRWDVSHVAFDDGGAACRIASYGPRGDAMTFWSNGSGVVYVGSDPAWHATPRTVAVTLDIDGGRWLAQAEVSGNTITIAGLKPEFLDAVAIGRTIALFTASGARLMTYSLEGSAAALLKMVECVEMLAPASDPFGPGAAPSSDPF